MVYLYLHLFYSFLRVFCIWLHDMKYSNLVQILCNNLLTSIWPLDWTLTGITTPGQSVLGSNTYPQSSTTGVSLTDVVKCHTQEIYIFGGPTIRLFRFMSRSPVGWVLPLCREAVSVFYSPGRLGNSRVNVLSYIKIRALDWVFEQYILMLSRWLIFSIYLPFFRSYSSSIWVWKVSVLS